MLSFGNSLPFAHIAVCVEQADAAANEATTTGVRDAGVLRRRVREKEERARERGGGSEQERKRAIVRTRAVGVLCPHERPTTLQVALHRRLGQAADDADVGATTSAAPPPLHSSSAHPPTKCEAGRMARAGFKLATVGSEDKRIIRHATRQYGRVCEHCACDWCSVKRGPAKLI